MKPENVEEMITCDECGEEYPIDSEHDCEKVVGEIIEDDEVEE